jgi:hypothetical protein
VELIHHASSSADTNHSFDLGSFRSEDDNHLLYYGDEIMINMMSFPYQEIKSLSVRMAGVHGCVQVMDGPPKFTIEEGGVMMIELDVGPWASIRARLTEYEGTLDGVCEMIRRNQVVFHYMHMGMVFTHENGRDTAFSIDDTALAGAICTIEQLKIQKNEALPILKGLNQRLEQDAEKNAPAGGEKKEAPTIDEKFVHTLVEAHPSHASLSAVLREYQA